MRSRIDTEVRRAEGLSRKGIEVEISERFESMVIARDKEQRIYANLIDRLEFFDQILDGYGGSRKLKDVVEELAEFRHRLNLILATHGVDPFQVEVGTALTPNTAARLVYWLERSGVARSMVRKRSVRVRLPRSCVIVIVPAKGRRR